MLSRRLLFLGSLVCSWASGIRVGAPPRDAAQKSVSFASSCSTAVGSSSAGSVASSNPLRLPLGVDAQKTIMCAFLPSGKRLETELQPSDAIMSPIRERLAYAARLKHGQSLHLMLGNPQEIVRDEQKVKDIVFGPSSPLANSQSPLARASRGAAGGSDPPVFPRQGDNLFQLGVAASNKKDHRTETGDEDDLAYLSGFDESAPAAAAPPPRPPASSRATEVAGDEGEEEDLAYLSGFDESGAGAAQAAQEELFCLHATVQEDPWLLLPPDQLPETESINSRRTRWSRAKQLLREDVLLELLRDAPNGGGVDDLRFGGARRDRSFCPRRLFLLAVLAGDVDVVRAIMPVAHEWIDELFDADDGILLHPYVNTYLASATPRERGARGVEEGGVARRRCRNRDGWRRGLQIVLLQPLESKSWRARGKAK